MENPENVLMELNGFEKAPLPTIPKSLEDYLIYVAKSGNTVFPWNKIKPLIKSKLEIIIREFNESCPEGHLPKMPNVDVFKFSEMKERIMEQLESYTGTPFTIQRLCELLVQPKRHYKRTDKFMRGLEKVMLVVSTVDPVTTNPSVQDNGSSMLVEREKLKVGACSQVYESPSKRIRLASAEEEGGPCDSADGAASPCGSKEIPDLCSAPGPSTLPGVSLPSTSTATTSPSNPITEGTSEPELDSMDIDTECTSSEARLSIPGREEDASVESSVEAKREEAAASSPEGGVESSQGEGRREVSSEDDDWVMVEKPAAVCDSGLVSTSAGGQIGGQEGGQEVSVSSGQDGVSDSTEGEVGGSDSTEVTGIVSDSSENEVGQVVTDSEAAAEPSDIMDQGDVVDNKEDQDKSDTCSSSDQGELLSVERGEEETNSEAEPAEEREEMVEGEENTDSIVSVQSSEERNVMNSVNGAEPRGAADSSDEISGVVTPSPALAEAAKVEEAQAEQPTCSEGEVGKSTVKQQEVEVEDGNSPDQSDTAQ